MSESLFWVNLGLQIIVGVVLVLAIRHKNSQIETLKTNFSTLESMMKLYNVDEVVPTINNTNADEALSALEVLGFVRKTAEKVVEGILKINPEASIEDIIKQALKKL